MKCCADMACAIAIETVKGTTEKHVRRFFPPHDGLDFPLDDLLAWRDKLYRQHWVAGI
jgi:hypothetical protein